MDLNWNVRKKKSTRRKHEKIFLITSEYGNIFQMAVFIQMTNVHSFDLAILPLEFFILLFKKFKKNFRIFSSMFLFYSYIPIWVKWQVYKII